MSVIDQWKAAGLVTVLLPSGFRVRGVLPSPTEVIRRRIVPYQLRQAVGAMGGKKMSALNDTEHMQLVEARRYQLAAFIREMAPPGSVDGEGWEKVELSVNDLADMPPNDVEALDDLIMGLKTPEMITADSMTGLGMLDKETAERIAAEEADATVAGFTEFRPESGRTAAGETGGAVELPTEPDDRGDGHAPRTPARRRAAPAARSRGD